MREHSRANNVRLSLLKSGKATKPNLRELRSPKFLGNIHHFDLTRFLINQRMLYPTPAINLGRFERKFFIKIHRKQAKIVKQTNGQWLTLRHLLRCGPLSGVISKFNFCWFWIEISSKWIFLRQNSVWRGLYLISLMSSYRRSKDWVNLAWLFLSQFW